MARDLIYGTTNRNFALGADSVSDNEVQTKQARLMQFIQARVNEHESEKARINKRTRDENKKYGLSEPEYQQPLLVTENEYRRLLKPYREIVDHFLKQGKLLFYSKANPSLATYFLIIEGRPDQPQYSEISGALPEGATGYAPTKWWTREQAEKMVEDLMNPKGLFASKLTREQAERRVAEHLRANKIGIMS